MSTIAGRFLTVEGIEGVGKSTQVARLSKALSALGTAHVVTREPGGTPLAEKIREIVLDPRDETLPPTGRIAAHVRRTSGAPGEPCGTQFDGWALGDMRSFHRCHIRLSRRRPAVGHRGHPRAGNHGAGCAPPGSHFVAGRARADSAAARTGAQCRRGAGSIRRRTHGILRARAERLSRARGG